MHTPAPAPAGYDDTGMSLMMQGQQLELFEAFLNSTIREMLHCRDAPLASKAAGGPEPASGTRGEANLQESGELVGAARCDAHCESIWDLTWGVKCAWPGWYCRHTSNHRSRRISNQPSGCDRGSGSAPTPAHRNRAFDPSPLVPGG